MDPTLTVVALLVVLGIVVVALVIAAVSLQGKYESLQIDLKSRIGKLRIKAGGEQQHDVNGECP